MAARLRVLFLRARKDGDSRRCGRCVGGRVCWCLQASEGKRPSSSWEKGQEEREMSNIIVVSGSDCFWDSKWTIATDLLLEDLCLDKITGFRPLKISEIDTLMRMFCFTTRSFYHQLISPWVSFPALNLGLCYFLLTELRRKLCLVIWSLAGWLKFEFGSYWLNQAFDLVAYCPLC